MRFRPISVWLSATPIVAKSHKINTQSACLRQLIWKSFILLLISNELVPSEIMIARDMPIFLFVESGYVYGFRCLAERTKSRAIDSLGQSPEELRELFNKSDFSE